jgi:hypothetical protein
LYALVDFSEMVSFFFTGADFRPHVF